MVLQRSLQRVLPGLDEARQLLRATSQAKDRPAQEPAYEERIETYRAALEDAMADSPLDEGDPFLARQRERLGISREEDRVLRHLVRQTTVPRRKSDPDSAYEKLRILGQGSAGRTWLARGRSDEGLVVLKEPLDRWSAEPAILEAIRREAKLAARIQHPNIVEIKEILDKRPTLVMEHLPGGSLADEIQQDGRLSPQETARIGHGLALGLAAIHEAGIVHRDLAPGNVLRAADGRAVLADFGLARPTDGGANLLADDAGTEGYRAPEAGQRPPGPSADIYGLAAVLHACLHGHPPRGDKVPTAGIPQPLSRVLEEGLMRDPDRRPPSARTVAWSLEGYLDRHRPT